MKKFISFIVVFFIWFSMKAQQYKEGISIVQFTADFVKSAELNNFKKYNTHVFDITKDSKIFSKESVTTVPTIILFNNGNEETRIEANILLELPDDWEKTINKFIEEILSQKF
jgi:hypothetical protein